MAGGFLFDASGYDIWPFNSSVFGSMLEFSSISNYDAKLSFLFHSVDRAA
jgi:hypothetical protein